MNNADMLIWCLCGVQLVAFIVNVRGIVLLKKERRRLERRVIETDEMLERLNAMRESYYSQFGWNKVIGLTKDESLEKEEESVGY